jgi:RimJ/RimL family protein N-acetyltransferase
MAAPIPPPEPALTDGVVRLRAWRDADVDALVAAWHDAEVQRWTAVPAARSAEDAARWIAGWQQRLERGLALDLVVCPVDDDATVLGEVGLVPGSDGEVELGWWVAAAHRGRGVASRAVALLAGWCRTVLGAEPVAVVDPENPGSVRVAAAAGVRRATR